MTSSTVTLRDGVRLAYSEAGSGPVVLLHPGFSLTRALWEPLVAELEGEFRCVSFDPRGHGESDAPASGYTIERLAADIGELTEALALEDVTLVGHSIGGAIASTAVLDHDAGDRIARLVLLGPAVPGFVQREGQPYGVPREVFEQLLAGITADFLGTSRQTEQIFFHQADPEQAHRAMQAAEVMRPEVAAELFAQLGEIDLADRLPEIDVPVLALWGLHDTLSDPRWAGWFEERGLSGWQPGTLEHSSHGSMLDEPAEVARRIRDFVRTHPASPRP